MENYYEILQIPATATIEELKAKIEEMQRKWLGRTNAPDIKRRQEAEMELALIEQAALILLDASKRADYDKELESNNNSNNTEATEQKEQNDQKDYNDEQLIEKVWELLAENRVADAIVVAKLATECNKNNANAWAALARAHFRWREFEYAIEEYKKAIDIETNNPIHYYDLCDVYFDHPTLSIEEKLRYSEELMNKALSIDPTERAFNFRMAIIYKEQGKYDKAVDILKLLIETHGKDASLSDEIAIMLLKKVKAKMYCEYSEYHFTSKEVAEFGIEQLQEAKLYACSKNILIEIQKYLDLAEKALTTRIEKDRLIGFGIIPGIWFIVALINLSFFQIIISGAILFLIYKKSIIPVWKDTYEVVSGQRLERRLIVVTFFAAMASIFDDNNNRKR